LLNLTYSAHSEYILPSNHGTFYAAQFAALTYTLENANAAKAVLDSYFGGTFRDQIAKSGSQPFEAVRAQPFHYQIFNLEAMIVSFSLI
jgi:hypothetical protein